MKLFVILAFLSSALFTSNSFAEVVEPTSVDRFDVDNLANSLVSGAVIAKNMSDQKGYRDTVDSLENLEFAARDLKTMANDRRSTANEAANRVNELIRLYERVRFNVMREAPEDDANFIRATVASALSSLIGEFDDQATVRAIDGISDGFDFLPVTGFYWSSFENE